MDQKVVPITNVCIVADPQRCPPNYELIMKSVDREMDCDMWRENNMFKRITRYLCISRAFNQPHKDNKVLVGIQILNDRDFPPSGYQALEKTIDTNEKSMRKKQLCFRYEDRNCSLEAISDILFLTKTKKAPSGYTLSVDINGIFLCYKISKVPVETQIFKHSNLEPVKDYLPSRQSVPVPAPRTAAPIIPAITRLSSFVNYNPLIDVEFLLSPKYANRKDRNDMPIPSISYRSKVYIDNEFNYPFSLEKSLLQRV